MTCEEVRRSLDLYIDGEFDLKEQAQIEAHLSQCPSCKEYALSMFEAKNMVKMAYSDINANFRLKNNIRKSLSNRVHKQVMVFLYTVVVLVVVAVGLLVFLKGKAPTSRSLQIADKPRLKSPPSSYVQVPSTPINNRPSPLRPVNYSF